MRTPPPLRTHPQEGDPTGLANYIESMPGGKRLTGWEKDPIVLMAVWVSSESPRLPLPYVFEAFPPRNSFNGAWSAGYLFQVPELVADMLTWYAEEGEWQADIVPLQEGETLDETAVALQKIWASAAEDPIEDVLTIHHRIKEVAQENVLDSAVLREVAMQLWKDSEAVGYEPYEDSITKAVAVLAK